MSKIGKLPKWDLSGLYPGRESEQFKKDLVKIKDLAKKFNKKYCQKFLNLV